MGLSVRPAPKVVAEHATGSGEWTLELELPGVRALAASLGKTVSFFDLETTGLNWAGESFGIVEVAVIHVPAEGPVEQVSSLINPENPCEWHALKKHGISSGRSPAHRTNQGLGALQRRFLKIFRPTQSTSSSVKGGSID